MMPLTKRCREENRYMTEEGEKREKGKEAREVREGSGSYVLLFWELTETFLFPVLLLAL